MTVLSAVARMRTVTFFESCANETKVFQSKSPDKVEIVFHNTVAGLGYLEWRVAFRTVAFRRAPAL